MMRRRSYRYSRLREQRRRGRQALIGGGILLLFLLCVLVARAPQLRVKEIKVEGARTISPTLVQSTAQTTLAGSQFLFFPKNNMLWFPKEEIAKEIARAIPSVKKVSVYPAPPNTIRIRIEEHTPQAFMCESSSEKGLCFFLDDGIAFATTTISEKISEDAKLFEIKKEGEETFALQKRAVSAKEFSFATELFNLLSQNRISISAITLKKDGDVYAETRAGAIIKFSSEMPIEKSITNLNTLITSEIFKKEGLLPPEGFSKIEYIDVRFGNKLYYKANGTVAENHETNP